MIDFYVMPGRRRCAAVGCTSVQGKFPPFLSFFGFPTRDEAQLSTWTCHVETRPEKATTSKNFLCELHFSTEDIKRLPQGAKSPGTLRKRLRPGAVPQNEWEMDPPQLQPEAAVELEPAMPQLQHFSADPSQAEMRAEKHRDQQAARRRQLAIERQDRLRTTRRILQRSRRLVATKKKKRRLLSYEQKLAAVKQRLNCMQHLVMEANGSREQFERLMTDRGRQLLQQPFRGKRGTYSEQFRVFVSQLHFCSPKAYSHLRNFFRLPAASTIRKWHQIDCRPGITSQSIQKIKELAQKSPQFKDWVLTIDAMHIRNEVCWSPRLKKMIGFVDVGVGNEGDDDLQQLARESVVVLAVGMRSAWKLPVAFILPMSATPTQQSQMIHRCVEEINAAGAIVRAVVGDCAAVNLATFRMLGAEIPSRPQFSIRSQSENIYVFLDNCHLIKLVRNSWSDLGTFIDGTRTISWKYVELLHRCQESEGGRLGNRLSNKHMQWKRLKMKVSLATQTLSASVADAMEFLRETGISDFQHCRATVEFVRCMDTLFDIFNSR